MQRKNTPERIVACRDLAEKKALGRFFAHCFKTANDRAAELAAAAPSGALPPFSLRTLTDMVGTFKRLFETKRLEIDHRTEVLEQAVNVIAAADNDSIRLKTAVTELEIEAELKKKVYEELVVELEKEEARVIREEEKVIAFEAYVQTIKNDVDNQLELVTTDLNEGVRALSLIDSAEIAPVFIESPPLFFFLLFPSTGTLPGGHDGCPRVSRPLRSRDACNTEQAPERFR